MVASSKLHRQRGRLSRRRFLLATAAVAGGGLVLAWSTRTKDSLAQGPDVLEPNAFLQITPAGQFIFQLDKVEMGQGTMTGLATLVAEELDVDPARFDVRFAPVLPTFQRPIQMTGQSASMHDSWEVLRETGATARAMLLSAAAARLGLAVSELATDNGAVIDPVSGERIAYGALAASAAQLSPPRSVELKAPADYRWIGQAVPRLDIQPKISGAAVYGIDVKLPNMLTAVVARIPEIGATLTDFDADEALTMPGVDAAVALENGVAVVAEDFWSARQAAQRVTLEWTSGELATKSDASVLAEQRAQLQRKDIDADYAVQEGDVRSAFAAAEKIISGEYTTPFLAHAPMEPLNATVHVQGDRCDLWLPTQAPDMTRQVACDLLGLSRDQVHVHTTFIGGGFGRRFMWDFVVEAVEIARNFTVPVQLIWTREDDIRHSYYRQLTVHEMRGCVDSRGIVSGWEHRQAVMPTGQLLTPPTMSTLLPEALSVERRAAFGAWLGKKTVEWMGAFQARENAANTPYAIANKCFTQFSHHPGVPISIWRSVGSSYNAFVVESFVDELAHAAGQDPLEFREERLQEHPRQLAVLHKLRAVSGWSAADRPAADNSRHLGIAINECFGTVVGQVAEVSVANGTIRVHKVYCVVDCGRAVTPDIVKQQMEGGILFGLTAALYGEINIDNGRVRQSNFHDYRMLRMADSPAIETYILPSEADPTGVGEPATPVIAPAVANAVFAASGQRLRSLPLRFA